MRSIFYFASLVICALLPRSALAYCSEPSFYSSKPAFSGAEPGAPSKYQKPDVPYCLSSYSYSGSHTCEDYELDQYFNEVNEYIDDLNDFYEEAVEFAEEARAYAEQAAEFANDVRRHADDVLDYAKCEADEVKRQHE
ncbi:hypothetical protein MU516_07835 [Paracoccus sp. YLB-12]|uniref:Uncharacterized protein n=1 Tax=Paracoccus maritimus TaxID=2933292 RepID=A0ABT2K8A9_9RHOB|nr:hypothetical protein [Paracoccus sp. YLB-12]MCT4332777.1 hypothetical protein [Paracoccus sp. YLB-12]